MTSKGKMSHTPLISHKNMAKGLQPKQGLQIYFFLKIKIKRRCFCVPKIRWSESKIKCADPFCYCLKRRTQLTFMFSLDDNMNSSWLFLNIFFFYSELNNKIKNFSILRLTCLYDTCLCGNNLKWDKLLYLHFNKIDRYNI